MSAADMARRRLVTGSFRGLVIPLLAAQLLFVISESTVQNAVSSMLAEANRTVPDYVTRYAPLVWLHSEDPFRPADLLEHVRHTTPMVNQKPVSDLPELDLDNLAMLNNIGGDQVALTSNDDIRDLPAWIFGETPDAMGRVYNATPCVVILVEHSSRDIDAFFFYFYSYDRGANLTQVLEPLNHLIEDTENGMHFGNHVGDWEHNMIRFRDGKPIGIYYSQHADGAAYDWNDVTLSMKNERPVVFSAYGSHANYPSPGDHVHDEVLVDYCDAGQVWDPVLSAYFYHLDPASFTLTRLSTSGSPFAAAPNLTSFFYFTGMWGDAQYPDDDPRQKTVPYFGLQRYVSGPAGPAEKQLVRKGLFPDHRESKSWIQWAVGIFMSLYPCCLRGWRAWVSGTVVIGLGALIVLGIRFGVRRYRLKGYKRVETEEIPLSDLECREDVVFHRAEVDQR